MCILTAVINKPNCYVSSPVVITAHSELCKILVLALSMTFLFVYEISLEPLNGSA